MVKIPVIENFFDNIDCEEKACVLGFWFADGCLAIDKRNSNYRIQFNIKSTDSDYLISLSKCLTHDHSNHVKIINNGFTQSGKQKQSAQLYLYNQTLCKSLMRNGAIPRKSLVAEYPLTLGSNIDINRHFIRAYFDGDGSLSVGSKSRIDICGTFLFLSKMKQIIETNVPVNVKIYKIKTEKISRLSIAGPRQSKLFCDWIYKDASIFLIRKYDLYLQLCDQLNHFLNTQ